MLAEMEDKYRGHGGGVNFVIDLKFWFCALVFKGECQSHRSVRDIYPALHRSGF